MVVSHNSSVTNHNFPFFFNLKKKFGEKNYHSHSQDNDAVVLVPDDQTYCELN